MIYIVTQILTFQQMMYIETLADDVLINVAMLNSNMTLVHYQWYTWQKEPENKFS